MIISSGFVSGSGRGSGNVGTSQFFGVLKDVIILSSNKIFVQYEYLKKFCIWSSNNHIKILSAFFVQLNIVVISLSTQQFWMLVDFSEPV